ncbi:hypothetical protein SAMN00790413_03468 [Deinococcus hopiensis KR-140]|uniref:Uncharacterized protein n=1 Tax=Deinococcus hopiensis KR-140 TaxID=695939 RepID=A0A1W1UXX1_9DEIO|nr:hypothetical protein SAMN00790413_03468 [Deinococcus hopiensis KR-140]
MIREQRTVLVEIPLDLPELGKPLTWGKCPTSAFMSLANL